jgi:uncharacterized protein with NRDE domain
MCTLIAFYRVNPTVPLVVAANRDEFYARRASPPALLLASPRAAGGRDEEKGGTWLGATETGLFVGLTNQRVVEPPNRSLRSRGEIVLGALAYRSADEAAAWLRRVDPGLYNPFNLLIGDAHHLLVAYSRSDAPEVEIYHLPPGIWVLPNDRIASPDFPKAGRAEELAKPLAAEPSLPNLLAKLPAVLGDHELPTETSIPPGPSPEARNFARRLQALCVHTPAYGTRSAAILAIDEQRVVKYLAAEGPPCTAPFHDATSLLTA